jgi:putative Mn2+ efflux pump MntP
MEPDNKPPLTAQEYKDRFINRRRMAWISFTLLGVFGGWMVYAGLESDEVAKRIDTMSFIIGSLFGMWTTIVLAYFGISTMVDIKGLKP